MSEQIRGLETSAYLAVDGEMMAGSFTKIENWSVKPKAEIAEGDFIGEDSSEPDLRIDGYDFSFTMQEKDDKAMTLWKAIAAKYYQRLPYQNINLVVLKKYRNPAVASATVVCENAVLKLDDHGASSRKDFIKSSWTGSCRRIS